MSEVFNRMIARARAPLSNVEPVYSPRFAESRLGGQALPSGDAGVEEIGAESIDRNPAASEEATTGPEIHTAAASDDERPDTGNVALSATLRVVHEEEIGEGKAPETRRARHPVSDAEVKRPHLGKPNLAGAKPKAAEVVPLGNEKERFEADAAKAFPGEAETAKSPSMPKAQAFLPTRMEPAPPPVQGEDKNNPETRTANQEPNVIISIGHIEIRAAQTMERPRKTPFRPKLSLADFLSHKQGDIRE